MRKEADSTGKRNTLASGAAGIGMGIIGVGIPDIPMIQKLKKSGYFC